jgi:transmembrane sensor
MEETRFSYLFNRYYHDQATDEELNEFYLLARSEKHSPELAQLMSHQWEAFEATKNPFDALAKERMLSAIHRSGGVIIKQAPTKRIWPKIAIAAAIAAIISSVGILFFRGGSNNREMPVAYLNDVAPGKQGATLTLASGKTIKLTDIKPGELAKEAGVVITKTTDGQLVYEIRDTDSESNNINTLSTAKGQTYQLRLPDGSLVWLNAASSLTYSADLMEDGKRKVKLEGEGYFEIAKDRAHPFIVASRGQEVEVLGTHFNINSYEDEGNIRTTLLEGSVRVNQDLILQPNQQSIVAVGSKVSVRQVDVNGVVDWKNGDFIFSKESLAQIMREVARWYDVDISYDPDVNKNQTFSGLVSRSKHISEVLLSMESTGKFKFKIDKRRITVTN